MYVCICKAVTDKQIRRAAANGVDNLYELRETLGVASACGSCASQAQEILQENQSHPVKAAMYVPSSA